MCISTENFDYNPGYQVFSEFLILCNLLTVVCTHLAVSRRFLYTVTYRSSPGEWVRPVTQRVDIDESKECPGT